jgi:hypothetical protein
MKLIEKHALFHVRGEYMPRKPIDLMGERFGRLVVVGNLGKAKNGNYRWLCQCDCGAKKEVYSGNLRSGAITSCGCLKREKRELRKQMLYERNRHSIQQELG